MQQRGQQWLEKLLSLSDLPADLEVTDKTDPDEDRPTYWLTIEETKLTSEQIQILIGPRGTVIDAIQYLANSIINLDNDPQQQAAYAIELNGYRAQRQAELQAIAVHAAEQVRQTGEAFELKSLSSAERRQIHTFLKECEDLETHSQGQEPDRRLVVRLR